MTRKTKPLAKTRPPFASTKHTISRKAGRKLINTHHTLEKQRKQAVARGDADAEREIAAQIAALGGLDRYQQASLQGQRVDRGGDTSRVLLEWLGGHHDHQTGGGGEQDKSTGQTTDDEPNKRPDYKPHMLEVGALSTKNACAASGLFEMELIDLHSREPGIVEQDFMQRPLPKQNPNAPDSRFDVISLSLVLNFVPDVQGRGAMLRRTLDFLKARNIDDSPDSLYPCLFLVLPRPCVSNSRYLTEERLVEMMAVLGYELARSKATDRLVYYLWRRMGGVTTGQRFAKKEVNPGGGRNNFAIVLET